MPDDHPGFTNWKPDDANHKFPLDELDVRFGDETGASVWVDLELPQTQPDTKAVAVRYAGVEKSTQLWIALECTADAAGARYELVLSGRHFHWFAAHAENGPGPLQEIRVAGTELGFGRRELLAAHGSHCDLLDALWYQWQGKTRCELTVTHIESSIAAFRAAREKARRDAEREPPRRIELPPWPMPDTPKPEPQPLPGGSMAPGRPGGLLGGLLALFRRIRQAVFG